MSTWSVDGTEVLAFEIDRRQVSLAPGVSRSFELDQRPAGVRAVLELYGSEKHNLRCNHVGILGAETPETWIAVSGSVSVTIGTTDPVSGAYPVTFELRDAAFQAGDGRIIRAGRPLTVLSAAGNSVGG